MPSFSRFALIMICCVSFLHATDVKDDANSLEAGVIAANADGINVVNFTADVTLVLASNTSVPAQVRPFFINDDFTFQAGTTITVQGNSRKLDGGNNPNARGFFFGSNGGGSRSATIIDLHFVNCRAKGGNGGVGGGGGGLGAGGAIFVGNGANVTLQDCTFSNCSAKGGNGAAPQTSVFGGGGGGGMRGNGGAQNSEFGSINGGGGGFGGNGGNGTAHPAIGGGGGGSDGLGAGNANNSTAGQRFSGTGASGSSGVGGNGNNTVGSNGGFGGGGGGGNDTIGGIGGFGSGGGGFGSGGQFGGGGGGGANGNGGFGGGGGNHAQGGGGGGTVGSGGFGGGDGAENGLGGKGAGFGGAIFIQNEGTLTLKTTSSFEKKTMFSENSAAAGDYGNPNENPALGALGQDIFMMSGGSLLFDLAAPVTMPSPIEGDIGAGGGDQTTGGLTKQGAALLTLTGDNTYTGKTTAAGGELRINGSVISEIEIQPGATLSGNFTAKKVGTNPNSGKLTNLGTLSPGTNGEGNIQLEGDYVQDSLAKLIIDITPVGKVKTPIIDTTKATLDGTIEVILSPGNYISGTKYIITDGTTTGTFTNIVKKGDAADDIEIKITYGSAILTVLTDQIFTHQLIFPGIPQQVAHCMTSTPITPDTDFARIIEALGTLSDKELNKTLTALSAVRYGTLEWANARNNSYAADILSQHLLELCCSPRKGCSYAYEGEAWVSVFGNLMNNKKQIDNLQKFHANGSGILTGVDLYYDPFYYGAALGYTHTDLLLEKNGGKGDVESYYGALYGSWIFCNLSTDLSFLGGAHYNDIKRTLDFATIHRTAKGKFWSYFFTAHLGLRGDWTLWGNTFEPFALADYHYYMHPEFTEKGAKSVNLTVDSKEQHIMRGEAGLKWYYEVDRGCYCYAPYLGISWVGEFPLNKSKQPAQFIDQSCTMNVLCYDSDIHLGAPQAGVKWSHCNGTSFLLGYKGLFNDKIHIHEIEGRLEWVF